MSTGEEPHRGTEDPSRFAGGAHHGWSPDKDEPGVTGAGSKAFDADNAGEPGPGRVVSDEEREGVPATDTSGATPLGVGESTTRRGEDVAKQEDQPGRQDVGTQGPSERPVGISTAEDNTKISPEGPIHQDSPNLPRGDQGG